MESVLHFLNRTYDGAPVWGWLVGAVILHLEWWLPRTDKFKSNSLLEAVPNLLLMLGGRFIPGLNTVLAKLGSGMPDKKTPPPPPTALLPWLAIGLTLASGCGFCSKQENQETARCKAQSVATDCALPAVSSLVQKILPQVAAALLSGQFDSILMGILDTLKKDGVADAWGLLNCTIEQVFAANGGAKLSPTSYKTSKANAESFRAAHPLPIK